MAVNNWNLTNKSLFESQLKQEQLLSDLVLQLKELNKRIDIIESVVFSLAVESPQPDHELFYEKVYIKNPMLYPYHELPSSPPCHPPSGRVSPKVLDGYEVAIPSNQIIPEPIDAAAIIPDVIPDSKSSVVIG